MSMLQSAVSLFQRLMGRASAPPVAESPGQSPADRRLDLVVRRLRMIPVETAPVSPRQAGEAVDHLPRHRLVVLAELAALGYEIENPQLYADSLLDIYPEIISTLRQMRGGNVDYVPLFQGFPDNVPEENSYFVDRLVGYVGNHCGVFQQGRKLDNGAIIPEWLFDLEQFGADPITQFQDKGLFESGRQKQQRRKADDHTEWIRLRLAGPEEVIEALQQFLCQNLYARSSIQESLRPDLEFLLELFSTKVVDFSQVTFRETRILLMKYLWVRDQFDELLRLSLTATDLLRLMASLTDSDVSLSEPIRYPRLKRAQRTFMLKALESCSQLEADLRRYRGLWLALGRGLHPGAEGRRFPRTHQAFQQLRQSTLRSEQSQIEMALVQRKVLPLLPFLRQRPGMFARRLHHLLEVSGEDASQVLEAFRVVASKVPLRNLLVMRSHFASLEQSPYRTVINKRGRIRVLPNRLRISASLRQSLLEVLDQALQEQVAARPSWAGRKVWIDPGLANCTVPLQLRKASEGLRVLGRGSRVGLDTGKVLRVFVYWKEARHRTDLDLSLIQFGPELEYRGHVSWTRLSGEGAVHSGDIQSAPHGAAEFIDVDLETLVKNRSIRYLAPQINRYCGDYFELMTCHTGWMLRHKIEAVYATFDIKTVQNKFDLTGSSHYAVPFLVDLWERQVIYVDLYVRGVNQGNTAEGALDNISLLTGEVARMLKTRPTMSDLAQLHILARGARRVDLPEQADLIFGVEQGDFSMNRLEQALSQLL